MRKVLFLCTHNSCRSQMAEGIVNQYLGDRFRAYSAGTEATRVHPGAIEAMREIGIDISGHRSKTLEEFAGEAFDFVITLCGDANDKCPLFFGGVERVHMGFPDPSRTASTEEEVRDAFRRVRDEIRKKTTEFLAGGAE